MNKIMLIIVASLVTFGTYFGCGKDKDDKKPKAGREETPEPSTSFLLASKSDLPPCNSGRAGFLAYVTDESKFYACDGTEWIETDIKGPKGDPGEKGETSAAGSGIGVYDANGQRLGALISYGDQATVLFSNGGVAKLDVNTGKYCGTHCSDATACATSLGTYYPAVCAYSTNNCTGTCYTSNKPIKNSVFFGGSGAMLKGTGSESSSSVSIQSFWHYRNESCVISGAATWTVYPVAETYSLPSGLTYPFANGELTLK